MKKLISIILTIVMVMSLVACGTPEVGTSTSSDVTSSGEENLKVGFSLPSMTFPFYVRMYDQINIEGEARGWEVSFVDGNLDANTQMSGLQDMINDNVDVLIIATWYIDALVDIFAQCEEKGIAVFLMDNMTIPSGTENAITFTTGTDNYNAGVVGGTWYANELKLQNRTTINVATISSQTEQALKRGQGFISGMEENGITVNVLNTFDGGKRETAMTMAEDALTALEGIELIFGSSAQDSLGAYDATIGANRTEVAIMGFDGEDEELALVDEKGNYVGTITQDPNGQATLVSSYVDMWVAGETFEQKEETPAGVYTPAGQLKGSDITG